MKRKSDPSPEEIAKRSAEVRAGWSVQEEARRRCSGVARWELACYSIAESHDGHPMATPVLLPPDRPTGGSDD